MARFSIQWRSSTRKDLRSLSRQEVARIITAVTHLANEPLPHGSQKLAGSERTYRIRIGDYRVIYEVFSDTHVVEVQRVRHRKDVYRDEPYDEGYPCFQRQEQPMPDYIFSGYFENNVLRKRPSLRKEWCIRVVENPLRTEQQDDDRVRFWGAIEELDGRYLRVITLADKLTILNAFPDRRFKP